MECISFSIESTHAFLHQVYFWLQASTISLFSLDREITFSSNIRRIHLRSVFTFLDFLACPFQHASSTVLASISLFSIARYYFLAMILRDHLPYDCRSSSIIEIFIYSSIPYFWSSAISLGYQSIFLYLRSFYIYYRIIDYDDFRENLMLSLISCAYSLHYRIHTSFLQPYIIWFASFGRVCRHFHNIIISLVLLYFLFHMHLLFVFFSFGFRIIGYDDVIWLPEFPLLSVYTINCSRSSYNDFI